MTGFFLNIPNATQSDILYAEGAMILQIAILYFGIYWTIRLLKGAPGLWQLVVVAFVLGTLQFLADLFRLQELEWLLGALFKSLPIIIVILFSAEIRRVFDKFTRHLRNTFFTRHSGDTKYAEEVIDDLSTAVESLAASKTGALIAMEQVMDLEPFCRSGKRVDSEIGNNGLLETIFYKGSPLHDGGVIIRKGRIEAAACIFPVSHDKLQASFGLRHRAALGLSNQTDALVLVVSEESGSVHIALNGQFSTIVSSSQLKKFHRDCFSQHFKKENDGIYAKLKVAWQKVRAFFVLGRKMFRKGEKEEGDGK
ncbi:MAG: diadenylate cyclase CdaA [Victivallales bacterium]|nr:diadenylate cyclase CdaA [Victivallales bacterium]